MYGGGGNEDDSIQRDFEAQTDRAVARALRVVALPGDPVAQPLEHNTPLADEDDAVPTADQVAASEQHCGTNVMTGCADAGQAYLRGRGVKPDVYKCLAILEKACTAENWASSETLGTAYSQGWGVDSDPARAVTYYTRGCDRAHARSCTALAVMYLIGTGVVKDHAKALTLFQKACSANDPDGCELAKLNANLP
jgi:hypothetical protein